MEHNCSRWSDSPERDPQSLYSALSQNLVRYQELHKKTMSTKRYPRRLLHPSNTIDQHSDKQNQGYQSNYLERLINPLTQRIHLQPLKACNRRVNSVKGQRSNVPKEQERKSLRVKEVRFERKDRKRGKDKWVDVFLQAGSRSEKISLLKLDNINKTGRQQKLDMFLKLLKR